MSTMTKGQRNEIKRQEYQKRVDVIKLSGYTITERRIGPKGYADSYSYYLNKDGVCIHPGSCYDWHESALRDAETAINKSLSDKS